VIRIFTVVNCTLPQCSCLCCHNRKTHKFIITLFTVITYKEIEAREAALLRAIVTYMVAHVKCQICMCNIFTSIGIKGCYQRIVLFTILTYK